MATRDVAIIGGGPAGSIAAILLARAGAKVLLVDPAAGRDRIEGLSPRAVEMLLTHGLETSGAGAALPRAVDWGGKRSAPGREHPVRRPAFDASLRAQAARERVTVIAASARRLAAGQAELPGETLRAGLVVDARGRAAPAVAKGLRGPATLAITGWGAAAGDDGSSIEARPDGWVWRVITGNWSGAIPQARRGARPGSPANSAADRAAGDAEGLAWVQIVRDARGLAGGTAGLARAWRRMLGEAAPPGLSARSAELRLMAPELDPALPRIGDAALAMDSLSGHGMFWAISSALAAPPMLRAILDGDAELARAFHRDRIAAQFWRQARIGRDFHRQAGFDTPFWRSRAAWPDDAPTHASPTEPSLRRQVVVRDGRLAEAEALVTPSDPDGVAFVAGREIVPVLRRLGRSPMPGRAEFCARILPEAPPAEAGLIHDWLTHRGIDGLPRTEREQGREVPA